MTCDSKQCWTIEQVRAECGLAHSAGIAEGRRLEREAIVALLDRGIEKHKARDTQVADYLRNLRHRVLSGEHEKGERE